MSQVRRIYAEKRPGYDVAARQLCDELREALGTDAISRVRVFQRYDVEGLSDEAFDCARGTSFQSRTPMCFMMKRSRRWMRACLPWNTCPVSMTSAPTVPASVCSCSVRSRRARRLPAPRCMAIEGGHVTGEMMDAVAHHLINPVEARQAGMEKPETLEMTADVPDDVAVVACTDCP